MGDLMLDEYIWGGVTRISPEAPVSILESQSENSVLGGTGNLPVLAGYQPGRSEAPVSSNTDRVFQKLRRSKPVGW